MLRFLYQISHSLSSPSFYWRITLGNMNKDFPVFIIVGMIIGILLTIALIPLFIKDEPLIIKSIMWHERTPVDTGSFYIDAKAETIYIDTTTRLLDMPIRTYSKLYYPPFKIDNRIYNHPVKFEATYQGLLKEVNVSTDENWQVVLPKIRCKTDWKWPVISFLGGILFAKIVD